MKEDNRRLLLRLFEFPCGIFMSDWLELPQLEKDNLWKEHLKINCWCTRND